MARTKKGARKSKEGTGKADAPAVVTKKKAAQKPEPAKEAAVAAAVEAQQQQEQQQDQQSGGAVGKKAAGGGGEIDDLFGALKGKKASAASKTAATTAAAAAEGGPGGPAGPSKDGKGKDKKGAPPRVAGSKDDIFGTEAAEGRKRTEEGFAIYKEDELGFGKSGGNTDQCPFDCECCF